MLFKGISLRGWNSSEKGPRFVVEDLRQIGSALTVYRGAVEDYRSSLEGMAGRR